MFGLMTSNDLAASASNNARRQVFYQYPQGTFPLMGLLSLMENREETDKQSFGWHEDRWVRTQSETAMANAAGPFTDTSGASGAVGVDLTAAGWSQAIGTSIRIKVVRAEVFRERDNIWVKDIVGTASSIKQIKGIVTAVWTAQNTIDVRLNVAVTNALNTVANNAKYVLGIGSTALEGSYSKDGGYLLPVELSNYTQIFRSVVGPFSRNALKLGVTFDNTGVYRDDSKKTHLRHMELMEQAIFWGERGTQNVVDAVDGKTKPEKTMGGIEWFLKQWELGNTTNGGLFDYRPGGADLTALAWDGSEDKRILRFGGASISKTQFESVIERAFLNTSTTGFEKLFVGGSGLLGVINRFAEANSIKMVQLKSKEDTYGMQVTVWESVYGTVYFKSHPLFNANPALRNTGFIVDVGSLGYHPFQDSDTELLTNRQANDFDGRKDEWLTEFGLELNFPERFLMIDNLGGITV